jgi:glutaredoxin
MEPPTKTGYFMYSKSNCKWCNIAKDTLPGIKIVNLDHLTSIKEKTQLVTTMADHGSSAPHTFPFVFFNGIYLGGCTESLEHNIQRNRN